MIVDVHAHYAPRRYYEKLVEIGGRSLPEAARPGTRRQQRYHDLDTIGERFEHMEDAGVEKQVLTPAGSPPYADRAEDAAEAARLINDTYAEAVAKHPDRLAAFVSLPLPHVDASLKELRRGMDDLGMLGITLSCTVFDRSTAEEEFEPIYEELNRRSGVVFYHPIQNGICSPLINDYGFRVAAGASLEDTAIVLHLIARRIPERYPNIRYIVPHVGGMIPMQLERLDNQGMRDCPGLTELPSVTARRLYYDTVTHGSQAGLVATWMAFGANHIVAGSDYPVLLTFETYKRTFEYIRESTIIPPADIDKILNHSAQAVLGLPH